MDQHSIGHKRIQAEKGGANSVKSLDSKKEIMKDDSASDKDKTSIQDEQESIPTGASTSTAEEAVNCPRPLLDDENFVDAFDEDTRVSLGLAKCSKGHIYLVGEDLSCIVCEDMENTDFQSED